MSFSISSSRRLSIATDFNRVFKSSCCKAGDDAFLLLATESSLEHARLGLVIAKKQLRQAVDRNLVKRISREAFRLLQADLAGLDIVVLCRSGVVGLDKRQIRYKLDTLFVKIASQKNRE